MFVTKYVPGPAVQKSYITAEGADCVVNPVILPLFSTWEEAELARSNRSKKYMFDDYKVYEIINGKEVEMPMKKEVKATEELLEKLCAAVSAEYSGDSPSPGVVLAILKDGTAYCSAVRYNQGAYTVGDRKLVVASAKAKTLRLAVIETTQQWLGSTAKRQLASLVGL